MPKSSRFLACRCPMEPQPIIATFTPATPKKSSCHSHSARSTVACRHPLKTLVNFKPNSSKHGSYAVAVQPLGIRITRVFKRIIARPAQFPVFDIPPFKIGLNNKKIFQFDGVTGLIARNHDLVELFARPDAHKFERTSWCNGFGQIADSHTGNFWYKHFTAVHPLKTIHNKSCALLQGDEKARHPAVSYRQLARLFLLQKTRNHAAATSDDVAIAHYAHARLPRTGIRVSCDKELVGTEL